MLTNEQEPCPSGHGSCSFYLTPSATCRRTPLLRRRSACSLRFPASLLRAACGQGKRGEGCRGSWGCGESAGCPLGGRESRRCRLRSLPFPPSRGRGGRGRGEGQGRSLGDGFRLRGKMTCASVRRKLSTVSRSFMIYDL